MIDVTQLSAFAAIIVGWLGSIEARIKVKPSRDDVEMMIEPQRVLLKEIKEDIKRVEDKIEKLGDRYYGGHNKD